MDSANRNTQDDLRGVIRQAVSEFVEQENGRVEPAYKAELLEERRRREQLERRVNELIEESQRNRSLVEETDRHSSIRNELQRHGVAKVDLAFKAIKDDIRRADDGRLYAQGGDGEIPVRDYISRFLGENPELLPPRISGGSGSPTASRSHSPAAPSFVADLDKIRPGMDREELERFRQEVARVAMQTLSGR